MAKPLGFKDFIVVDYKPGSDDQTKYRAKKRKQDLDRGLSDDVQQDEALDLSQRRARARLMKKNKAKIAMGRKRASRKTADLERLKKRARKQAINQVFTKLAKGQSRSEVTPARRQEIEKRLEKMKPRIDKIARKLLPQVRQKERQRRKGPSSDE